MTWQAYEILYLSNSADNPANPLSLIKVLTASKHTGSNMNANVLLNLLNEFSDFVTSASCIFFIKNSVLDSYVCSWDSLIWETASSRTHKPKIVNESLNKLRKRDKM